MMLGDGLKQFLEYLQNERRLSPLTLKNYQRDLNKVIDFCADKQIDDWQQLNIHQVRAFVARYHRAGLGGRSLQRALSALRTFFNYLLREGLVSNNPVVGVRAPRTPRKLPNAMDVDQLGHLLDIQGTEPLAVRDRAIMELIYSSGLRLAELISLNIADVDLTDATVRITGKGSKTRIVPMGRFALEAIEHWYTHRTLMVNDDEQAIFIGRHGRRLTPRAVQQRIRNWAIKQGITSHVHPHMLRHSFASHMLESSGDLRAVQELLGHADISTTQIYTHLDFQQLAKVYDESHPRAKRVGHSPRKEHPGK